MSLFEAIVPLWDESATRKTWATTPGRGEALPLLLTLSSGVKGFTTIHAGSARQALTRLRFVCQLADSELPMSALNALVSEAVDLVVHAARTSAGPRVTEIVAVEDLTGGAEATRFTVTPIFARDTPDGPLTWTGQLPSRIDWLFGQAGMDLRDHLPGDFVDDAVRRQHDEEKR